MRTVSATDAKQRLAALLDTAQREPVMIRRQNRDVAVLLSPHEYDRLRALNTDEFQRFCDRIAERIPIVHLVRASESATGMPPDASSTSRRHAACQVPRPHRRTTDRPGRSGPRPRQGDAYNDAWDCLPFGDA